MTRFTSTNPATGETVWEGEAATAALVASAVEAARAAFPDWADRPRQDRIDAVKRYQAVLKDRAPEMAEAISRETGKALWETTAEATIMQGKVDISIRAYDERTGERSTDTAFGRATLRHRPHGVAAVLGPFNFPGHLPNGHIMPALIAGNTVVFKPSEMTPGVAEFTVRLWAEAGLPPGVVNLVHGARAPAEALVKQEGVDGVLFTGGVATGQAIHRALAGRPDKILALELGGNNPLVAWQVRDADAAARIIIKSAYLTGGQRCTCARRLIAPAGEEGERILAALLPMVDRIRLDRPDADPQPFMGPLVSDRAAAAVLAAQDAMLDSGGKALRAARLSPLGHAYVTPGVIDMTDGQPKDEEVFGPLLQVRRVATFDEALEEANATRFGLAAGLISDDADLFARFEAEVRAGVLNWNRQTTGASGAGPFGGVGQSGNHRAAGYFAADYCAWPMASLIAPGAVKDDEAIVGLAP